MSLRERKRKKKSMCLHPKTVFPLPWNDLISFINCFSYPRDTDQLTVDCRRMPLPPPSKNASGELFAENLLPETTEASGIVFPPAWRSSGSLSSHSIIPLSIHTSKGDKNPLSSQPVLLVYVTLNFVNMGLFYSLTHCWDRTILGGCLSHIQEV